MRPASETSIKSDASDLAAATAKTQAATPEAVILLTAGMATPAFVKSYNHLRRGVQFYTMSVAATQATVGALGAEGVGIVVATVVPFPWSQSSSLAKEYQRGMKSGDAAELSFVGMEGFINAKVLVDALRKAGRELTRAKLLSATEQLDVDYGGFRVNMRGARGGSNYVELTIIGSNRKFIK
jgi:ABC-type branched-subunit amino acid transport system substrate-binding protein